MRFGWSSAEVSLFVEGFLFFVFFPIQERVGLETERSTEGKVGGGLSKASDSCLSAKGPRFAPGVGEEANGGRGWLTFLMALWAGTDRVTKKAETSRDRLYLS